jgi:hypothetical protein
MKNNYDNLYPIAMDIAIDLLLPHTSWKTKKECERNIFEKANKKYLDLQKKEEEKAKLKRSFEKAKRLECLEKNKKKMANFTKQKLDEIMPKIKKLAIKRYRKNPRNKYSYLEEAIVDGQWNIYVSNSKFYTKEAKDITAELYYLTTSGVEEDDVHFYEYFTIEELGVNL